MSVARDIQGTVFQNATATFMARVESNAGSILDQDSVASLEYSIYKIDFEESAASWSIVGHENVLLDKTAVVFNTLQNDVTWTVDETGYNFRHEIDVRQHEAFPEAGCIYQMRYELVPVAGQKIVFRFCVRCI